MTIEIAGIWELGWNTPIKELDLWECPLRDFGVDGFFMAPISGIRSEFVTEYNDLNELIILRRKNGFKIVFVDEKATTMLYDFEHPTGNVLYVFGRTTLSAMTAYQAPGDFSIRFETQHNLGLPWAHQAASIVLYDRLVKSWR